MSVEDRKTLSRHSRERAALLQRGPLLSVDDLKSLWQNTQQSFGQEANRAPGGLESTSMEWFLSAEADNSRVLRYLLAYHPVEIRPLAFLKVYTEYRERSMYFFTPRDQILPDPTPPSPPTTGVTEDMADYYKTLAKWGGEQDLANLGHVARRPPSLNPLGDVGRAACIE